jgi:hypothetical protein
VEINKTLAQSSKDFNAREDIEQRMRGKENEANAEAHLGLFQ